MKEHEPICICLQHVNTSIQKIWKYSLAASSIPKEGSLGTAIYVHHKATYTKIISSTDYLQNSIIRLNLSENKSITICNIYNQPNQNYNFNQIPDFLSNLQQLILIVKDFNAHHPLWDINVENSDDNGEQIEKLI